MGAHLTLAAKLSVDAATAIVQVVAEGGISVNTETQELAQVVGRVQLQQLPSLTRNPYDFVALSGNVSNADNSSTNSNSGQSQGTRGVGYAINGQRQTGTEILLDGVENINTLSFSVGQGIPVDTVQEYTVITNNYTAEYGRASGGVVNVTTKAGGNGVHGSVWEFNRLSAYTANTYANDAANSAVGSIVDPKGKYTRNQFGFQADGPIRKDKLFASVGTEWLRVRSSATETQEILDPAFIAMLPANAQAYFKAYGTGAYATRSGAVTTASQLSSAGTALGSINGITPVPGSTPIFDAVNFKAPFDAGGDVPQNTYSLVGRIDYNLNEKTQMFFRAAWQSVEEPRGALFYSAYPQYDVGYSALNQSFLYSLSHTFTNNIFGSAKLSFTRFNDEKTFDNSLVNTPTLTLTPPSDPVTNGFIQLPGLYNNGSGTSGLPQKGPQNTSQFEPNLAWDRGKHLMRFGGQFTYEQLNVTDAGAQADEQLGWTLPASLNNLMNTGGAAGGTQLYYYYANINPGKTVPCVANPAYWTTGRLSDLNQTAGCALSSSVTAPSYGRSYRYKDWALYAQDSYRIRPRLTLNYGVRYEHYGVQHSNHPELDSNFYPGSGRNLMEQIRTGSMQIADKSSIGQMWAPSWGTVAPRIGFAYDVFGDGRTSFRGGFGISYERNFQFLMSTASANPPGVAAITQFGATLTNDNNSYPSYLPPISINVTDPNIKVAQTQFWSLSLQRELMRNTVIELAYSGAHGVHLYDFQQPNLVGAGQAFLGDAYDAAHPYLDSPNNQYSYIAWFSSTGVSSYNSLNIKLQAQNVHNTGLSFVANYTWAHSLDDASANNTMDDLENGGMGTMSYTLWSKPKLDWGSSEFDVRQRFVMSPVWEAPWFKSGSSWERGALGGWTLSGIFTAHTGTPFSVLDYSNVMDSCTIPRLTPATPITNYHVGKPKQVGPNTFTALNIPLPASFAPLNSNLGISDFGPFPSNMTHRSAFSGPGAWNLDLAVNKRFKVTERVGMEFRAEGFNILNHHNYYINKEPLYYDGSTTTPLQVTELKGGLGSLAEGGNHDERRFGQLALRVSF